MESEVSKLIKDKERLFKQYFDAKYRIKRFFFFNNF